MTSKLLSFIFITFVSILTYAQDSSFAKRDSGIDLSYDYISKAEMEASKGNYGKAILAIQNVIEMEDSDSIKQNKPFSLTLIARYIFMADKTQLAIAGINAGNKYDDAIRYAKKSLELGTSLKIIDVTADNYRILSDAYEAKGEVEMAFKYFKMSSEILDSLYNVESTKNILDLKMQYETDKQEQKISLLRKDNLLQQEEVTRQKAVRNSFVIGLILILMIGGVALNRYKTKQIANKQLAINLEKLELTQQKLIEQEKLASLGSLAAGIAHEIKNPLNFINNFSELNTEIVEDLPAAIDDDEKSKMLHDLKSNFEKITEHGVRADSIVKNMLAHSNNEVQVRELTDINAICAEYFQFSYKSVLVTNPNFKCELKTKLDESLPKINLIVQDFSRVLINIFTNAFYAVREHKINNPNLIGEVSLTTKFENSEILICIRDNGTGMPEAIKEKIFEPFYTTKPAGQGTGLGLSLSFDIIKAHHGKIEVTSKSNDFTEFKITLPIT